MKQRTLSILSITATLLFAATACSEHENGTIDCLPVKTAGSDKWSLIDSKGEFLVENEFDKRPTMAVNGFFTVSEKDGITVYATRPHPSPLSGATGLVAAGVMTEGRMPVSRKGSRLQLIGTDGATIATLGPVNGSEIDGVSPYFSSGRMIFHTAGSGTDGGLFGAIDRTGTVTVRPIYARLYPYHHDIALAAVADTSTADGSLRYMLIDTDGKTLFQFPNGMTPMATGVYREIMPVILDGRPGFINKRGVFRVMPESVSDIAGFTDHVFAYTATDGRMGVMTMEHKQILPPVYREVSVLDNSHFLVTGADGASALLDRNAATICEFPESESLMSLRNVFPLESGFRIIGRTHAGAYILYDDNGYNAGDHVFDAISSAIVIDPMTTATIDMVRSDYFDTDGAVKALTNPLKTDGYADARLGARISSILTGDPEDFTSTYSATILSEQSRSYSIEAEASSTKPAARIEAVYSESSSWFLNITLPKFEGYEYRFNADATINRIHITLATENPTFTTTRRAIEQKISAIGFNPTESTDAYTLFRSASENIILLMPAARCCGSQIYILTRENADTVLKGFKREAEINFSLGTQE